MTRITVEIPEESKAEILSYLEAKGVYFEENEEEDLDNLLTPEQMKSLEDTKRLIAEGKMELIPWEVLRKKYFSEE